MSRIGSLVFYIIGIFVSGMVMDVSSRRKRINRAGIVISILIPSVISAFRYHVGTDYDNYNYIFSVIRKYTWIQLLNSGLKWEIGFKILIKVLTYIGNNQFIFGFLTFLTLSLTVYALMNFSNKNVVGICYTLYLFFYIGGLFNIVRQLLAVSIVLCAYRYIFENKRTKYIVCVLLAASIHVSALIALFPYFMWDHTKNRAIETKTFLKLCGIATVIIYFWRNILRLVLRVNGTFFSKFVYLFNNNSGKNRDIYVKLLIMIIFMLFYKWYEKDDRKNVLFIYLFALNCIISVTGFQITFMKRMALYFEVPFIILMGKFPKFFSSESRTILKIALMICFVSYFVIGVYILGHSDIIPYQTMKGI